MSDGQSTGGTGRFGGVLRSVRMHHAAFEMYLAGYRKRIRDEQEQPSDLRDVTDFESHLRDDFERKWCDVKPPTGRGDGQ